MCHREIVSEKQTAIALQSKVVDADTFNQLLLGQSWAAEYSNLLLLWYDWPKKITSDSKNQK